MRDSAAGEDGSAHNRAEPPRFETSTEIDKRTRAARRLTVIGEMTGGIAHDFRNLLAVIESGLHLAEKNCHQPEKARNYIAAAREGIDRGRRLTSQLLAFAKQPEVEARAGDVNELLTNLWKFLKYSAGPGVRIEFHLGADIPKCLVEPTQFDAAVINLVVNARDAMPNGGELHISTEPCALEDMTDNALGSYVRVRIRDSGNGMPAEVVQKIFDPFFTTKGENGTGMGLPHVFAYMRRIGGHIIVASEFGSGTTVDLLFPSLDPGGMATLYSDVEPPQPTSTCEARTPSMLPT
jgi:signal transduction histidine kinase